MDDSGKQELGFQPPISKGESRFVFLLGFPHEDKGEHGEPVFTEVNGSLMLTSGVSAIDKIGPLGQVSMRYGTITVQESEGSLLLGHFSSGLVSNNASGSRTVLLGDGSGMVYENHGSVHIMHQASEAIFDNSDPKSSVTLSGSESSLFLPETSNGTAMNVTGENGASVENQTYYLPDIQDMVKLDKKSGVFNGHKYAFIRRDIHYDATSLSPEFTASQDIAVIEAKNHAGKAAVCIFICQKRQDPREEPDWLFIDGGPSNQSLKERFFQKQWIVHEGEEFDALLSSTLVEVFPEGQVAKAPKPQENTRSDSQSITDDEVDALREFHSDDQHELAVLRTELADKEHELAEWEKAQEEDKRAVGSQIANLTEQLTQAESTLEAEKKKTWLDKLLRR